MSIKIGFIGLNENILFFQKTIKRDFRDYKVQVLYLNAEPKAWLPPDRFEHVPGSANVYEHVQHFYDAVDYIILNETIIPHAVLKKLVNVKNKTIPSIAIYSTIGIKENLKQLLTYLCIPTHLNYFCSSSLQFNNSLRFFDYPIVIKKTKHYQKLPSVCYIPKSNDQTSLKAAKKFITLNKRVIIEKWQRVHGHFTTTVWRSVDKQNIIISNNTCIYRDGVLLMVQPNYIKKPIYLQMIKIINKLLNHIDQVGCYIFEFYEMVKMKIILNNFKIGFDSSGNLDFYNYKYSQHTYCLTYLLKAKTLRENIKLNNHGALMVIGRAYEKVALLCGEDNMFKFIDFFKQRQKPWFACNGMVLSNRSYRSHNKNRELFRSIYSFKPPRLRLK